MHHPPRHHWDPALKAKEAKKIFDLSQEFWEQGIPTFVLLRGKACSRENAKGEGGNWEMERGFSELDSAYSSHCVLVVPCGHNAGSDTCNHSIIHLTARYGSTDRMTLRWADLHGNTI